MLLLRNSLKIQSRSFPCLSLRTRISGSIFDTAGSPSHSPIFLVGSIGTSHYMWNSLRQILEKDFFLVLVDKRGHGQSDAPAGDYSVADLAADVLTIADHLGIQIFPFVDCHLAVLSLNGWVFITVSAWRKSSLPIPPRPSALRKLGNSAPISFEATVWRRFRIWSWNGFSQNLPATEHGRVSTDQAGISQARSLGVFRLLHSHPRL